MSEEREYRKADVGHEDYTFKCFGCGKSRTLFYNGGELDALDCCGYRYSLETVRVDFVAIAPRSA